MYTILKPRSSIACFSNRISYCILWHIFCFFLSCRNILMYLTRTEKWASVRSMFWKCAKNLTLHGFFLSADFSIKFLLISRDVWGPALNWCGEPMYMYLPKAENCVWSKNGLLPKIRKKNITLISRVEPVKAFCIQITEFV